MRPVADRGRRDSTARSGFFSSWRERVGFLGKIGTSDEFCHLLFEVGVGVVAIFARDDCGERASGAVDEFSVRALAAIGGDEASFPQVAEEIANAAGHGVRACGARPCSDP